MSVSPLTSTASIMSIVMVSAERRDGDGVCNEDETESCTDAAACNYNDDPLADSDNTLCIYASDIYGVDNVDCDGACLNDPMATWCVTRMRFLDVRTLAPTTTMLRLRMTMAAALVARTHRRQLLCRSGHRRWYLCHQRLYRSGGL